jgi:hypothetical protein
MNVVTVVEIDLPRCSLTYSVAPCTAAVGVTGSKKCFNSRRTCQDVPNFTEETLTLRFMRARADVDAFDGLPLLRDVRTTPQQLNPGVDIGKRESVTLMFEDAQHSDVGLDKYLADRAYDPFTQGTFWGKLRARYPSLKGFPLRVRRGEFGAALSTFTTWNYVIESSAGPAGGLFSIVAKDLLKLANGDRAQAPRASSGVLLADLAAGATSATLSPAGIGNFEYPSSGKVAIGGEEICEFTRSADVLTLTRGASNTEDQDHSAEDRVQLVLEYDSESPADILYDLLVNYTAVEASQIPLADWQTEVNTFIGRLYSAEIAQPTDVDKLLSEIIEQVGLVMWTDTIAQLVRLTVLRAVTPSADVFTADRAMENSFRQKEQPGKRISQAWAFYGLRNPLAKLDDRSNYGGLAIQIDADAEIEYGEPAIQQVFSRWIDAGNRPAATRLNSLLIARYRDPPRALSFALHRSDTPPELGRGAQLTHWELQDDEGAQATVPVQVTSLEPKDDAYEVEAEEMLFAGDIEGKTVVIDSDQDLVNLRALYDQFYLAPSEYEVVTFIVETAVAIGGFPGTTGDPDGFPAVTVGDWPEGPTLVLINSGAIYGGGGIGGIGATIGGGLGVDGSNGGAALYTRYPIEVENNGKIYGGGGGGGGSSGSGGGGGGAGRLNGSGGGIGGTTGTDEAPGVGAGGGGNGGDNGAAGSAGTGGAAGAAGAAIDGASFVTLIVPGDILGAQIN